MATISNAARNAAANAILDLVDGGSTNPNGTITYTTTGGTTTLVVLALANPAWADAVNGVAAINTVGTANPTVNGTAAEAFISDRDATSVITGLTVGTSNADIIYGSVAWTTADTIGLSSLNATMPASPA